MGGKGNGGGKGKEESENEKGNGGKSLSLTFQHYSKLLTRKIMNWTRETFTLKIQHYSYLIMDINRTQGTFFVHSIYYSTFYIYLKICL